MNTFLSINPNNLELKENEDASPQDLNVAITHNAERFTITSQDEFSDNCPNISISGHCQSKFVIDAVIYATKQFVEFQSAIAFYLRHGENETDISQRLEDALRVFKYTVDEIHFPLYLNDGSRYSSNWHTRKSDDCQFKIMINLCHGPKDETNFLHGAVKLSCDIYKRVPKSHGYSENFVKEYPNVCSLSFIEDRIKRTVSNHFYACESFIEEGVKVLNRGEHPVVT